MAILKEYEADVRTILGRRHDNGADFWATADGRWGRGSPFSTFDWIAGPLQRYSERKTFSGSIRAARLAGR